MHVYPHVDGSATAFDGLGVIGTLDNFPNVAGGYAPVSPTPVATAGTGGIGSLAGNAKGDDAAPTKPQIAETSVTVNGDLDKTVVRRIVHGRFTTLRACYAKGLKANPSLHGVVNTTFEIGAAGSVVTASTSSSLGDASVESCVRGVFRSLVFPSATAPTSVVYPLLFTTTSSA